MLGALWMMFHHPAAVLALVVGFTVLVAWLMPKLLRAARRGLQRLRARGGGKELSASPAAVPPLVVTPPA